MVSKRINKTLRHSLKIATEHFENTPCRLREDASLKPFLSELRFRRKYILDRWKALEVQQDWHEQFGLHRLSDGSWIFREWLPGVKGVWLKGDFNGWRKEDAFMLHHTENGIWEGYFPASAFHHGERYGMQIAWAEGGEGYRLPSCATYVVRHKTPFNEYGVAFNAVVWNPENPYQWKHRHPHHAFPLIYESHVGMATSEERIGTFAEFTRKMLPRIASGGYNTVQLMGIQQHPYYGSFGYHVSSFYSICDLFGTPDEFKELVDTAHGLGLRVIIDLVHSHAASNETEGLSRQNNTDYLYFHSGPRGYHPAWGSRCFDYHKDEVCRFLLSNCRFWLQEYHIDGFRFDGVTSMLYLDHGLSRSFNGYDDYFSSNVDMDAIAYLAMANKAIHALRPGAWTIAEDVSGMPGLCSAITEGGCGFDFRLAMGVTDFWFKLADGMKDENWPMGTLWYELTNRRADERCISYVECHDQALVGGKSFAFTLMDADMYDKMHVSSQSLRVERGIALHKMARLLTLATAGHGYLNFMGNEFGHPEWIDFPREGNGWSYAHARRLWHLRDDGQLRFKGLGDFDQAMMALFHLTPDVFRRCPQLVECDEMRKIIVFERGGLYFAFNFHPTMPQPKLPVMVTPGIYEPYLDSDDVSFGGHGLIGKGWKTKATPIISNDCENWLIYVNLPPQTAVVMGPSHET
ncbi:MAG: alpha amylase C-terminal domain-containing protein [Victivallales bacterium]|nr:alpha amylase C-terminal domain-containing protein [Victivallales bacterium]